MRVDKHSPVVSGIDAQIPRRSLVETRDQDSPVPRMSAAPVAQTSVISQSDRQTGFSVQLNQQLTAMQAAESYLERLADTLGQLKLSLGRELGNVRLAERGDLQRQFESAQALLAQRHEQSGASLDSDLNLHLTEPARARFTLSGLESLRVIGQTGRASLLFSVDNRQSEPVAVVLDAGLTDEQVLRRFNVGLAPLGIRADLDVEGRLSFSAQENEWQQLRGRLRVQGDGSLFPAGTATTLQASESQILPTPASGWLDDPRQLRQVLEDVVRSQDRIEALREALAQRQEAIRQFLAARLGEDEQRWARDYVAATYELMRSSRNSAYSALADSVVAQATISRYTVISLLS